MYYDTEEFRVQYIHWYSRVEDDEEDWFSLIEKLLGRDS
jgi:hypothetical protein